MLGFKFTTENPIYCVYLAVFPLLCFMLIDLNLSIHSAIYHRVVGLILVCPLKCITGIALHCMLRHSWWCQ